MMQNGISGWAIQSMRRIGVAILLLGVVSLAFGVALLVSANTMHSEEVEQLDIELQATTIGELKDLREDLRDKRHDQIDPEDVPEFIQSYLTALNIEGMGFGEGPSLTDDAKWETWNGILLQEKGLSLAMLTLGTSQTTQFAGVGIVIAGAGLILAGLMAIGIGPGLTQMRKTMDELSKSP
ncbi:hypothetical protein ACFLXA_04000 [Chloroflexota bacterium]